MWSCKINLTDKVNRILVGVFLIGGMLLGVSKEFMIILGVIELIEGLMGRCALSCSLLKFRKRANKR